MKRILALFHGGWIQTREVEPFESFRIDILGRKLASLNGRGGEIDILIDRQDLQDVVRKLSRDYDAVFCGAADAALIQYFLARKRMRRPPFLIEDLHILRLTREACQWIEKHYGDNPFDDIASSAKNFWLHYVPQHRELYLDLPVRRENLIFLPGTSFLMSVLNPEVERYLKNGRMDRKVAKLMRNFSGKIFAGGVTNRDYATFIRACDALGTESHMVSDDDNFNEVQSFLGGSSRAVYHRYLPLPLFIEAIRNAKVVVVPLKNGKVSSGHFTLSLAMRLRKPIVMTMGTWSEDYMQHGETGLLVEPGNHRQLKEAIQYLLANPKAAKRMGDNAHDWERQLSERARGAFRHALEQVAG